MPCEGRREPVGGSNEPNHSKGEKMKNFRLAVPAKLMTVFFVAGIALAQGCGQDPPPMMGCQQRFEAMDTNKDGQVSKDEFLATPHQRDNPEQMFKTMDVNAHGYLTKDEFCSDKGMGQGQGKGMGQGQGKGMKQ
jgi:hypothetical protein